MNDDNEGRRSVLLVMYDGLGVGAKDVVDELVAWLGAQLDRDYQLAYDAGCDRWRAEDHVSSSAMVLGGDGGVVAGYRNGYAREPELLDGADADHIAEHDPARVLREVEAARLLIDRYVAVRDLVARCAADYAAWVAGKGVPDDAPVAGQNDPGMLAGLEFAVRGRALSYADRPGYREEWRP